MQITLEDQDSEDKYILNEHKVLEITAKAFNSRNYIITMRSISENLSITVNKQDLKRALDAL